MLVLSLFITPKAITKQTLCRLPLSKNTPHIPSISLLTLPDNIGPFYNCVHIYTWFWYSFHLLHPIHLHQHKATKISSKKNKSTFHFHHFHLYILLYFLINIGMTAAIYNDRLPLIALSIIPTFLGTTIIHHQVNTIPNNTPSIHQKAPSSTIITKLSSNSDKLAYLCAWQSLNLNSHRFMNFNPGGHPICVVSGAPCSISTNKFDFIEFTPTTNTVLCGITSGLQIEGKGTLRWTITNDSGDEIDLYIRDSLSVPSAPMCLLSPQQLLQQTNQNNDGVIVKDTYGILHFSSYKKTIYYNSSNNLPIFFTAPKFTTHHVTLYPRSFPLLQLLSFQVKTSTLIPSTLLRLNKNSYFVITN
jgi:hypothetical protein